VFLEHDDEQLRFGDLAGEEKFHTLKLNHGWAQINTD
jgi:hypothetical protein